MKIICIISFQSGLAAFFFVKKNAAKPSLWSGFSRGSGQSKAGFLSQMSNGEQQSCMGDRLWRSLMWSFLIAARTWASLVACRIVLVTGWTFLLLAWIFCSICGDEFACWWTVFNVPARMLQSKGISILRVRSHQRRAWLRYVPVWQILGKPQHGEELYSWILGRFGNPIRFFVPAH